MMSQIQQSTQQVSLNFDQMQSSSKYKQGSLSKYDNQDAWIADLDPMMQGGYKIAFYQPKFMLQVRTMGEDGQTTSVKQVYSLRILSLSAGQGVQDLKIQISSEEDLFRLYACKLNQKSFEKLRKAQHLNFSFKALIPMLIKQINLCQKQISQYNAVLNLNKISNHRLDLLENIEYKRIQLLSLDFVELDEQTVKNYVIFRFTKVRMNKQITQKKLKDVMSMTKLKNQNLWADIIKKEVSRFSH